MKHLKTYELQSFSILKVGDYVLLKYSNDIFKIIEIDYKWSNPYFLEYYKTDELSKMNCRIEDIERHAAPSEIEKYEFNSTLNKYKI